MPASFRFDLGIFDEAHKTAGRQGKNNSFALDDANVDIRKRLFVTATPRHYSPTRRTKEGEQALIYSMDNPAVYGPLDDRYELSFGEAARRRIICDYKIIVSTIASAEVTNELLRRGEVLVEGDSVRAQQVANQLAIKATIDSHGIKKIFSFHPRVKSAESFTLDGPEGINSIIPDLPAYHVYGAMNTADREEVMKEFAEQKTGIVSNAKCLTEGVDVPAVDMVAFMSPKKSKIDIVQATGRAMRRPRGSSRKKYGYVFIPLYIEVVKEETEEEAIKRLGFEELADVLNAMKEQDDVLADVIRQMREDRGRVGGYDDSRFRERVECIGQTVALDVLRDALTTYCVDRLGATWDERFGELCAYKEEHGHCMVTRTRSRLGNWCHNQRIRIRKGKLNDDRVARLNAIGFVFEAQDDYWEDMFSQLVAFKEEYGHCNVTDSIAPTLSEWCKTQRKNKRKGLLSKEKITKMELIGFAFDVFEARWQEKYAELKQFKEKFGHCNVPNSYSANPSLGQWVITQRRAEREGSLSQDKVDQLDSIGFAFNAVDAKWTERFLELTAFKAEYGHCNVPSRFGRNRKLATWCNTQRTAGKDGKLSEDKIAQLKSIGFAFDVFEARWQEKYAELKQFKEKFGHCNVPNSYSANPSLGTWCITQRRFRKQGKLSDKRIEQLDEIDFEWSRR